MKQDASQQSGISAKEAAKLLSTGQTDELMDIIYNKYAAKSSISHVLGPKNQLTVSCPCFCSSKVSIACFNKLIFTFLAEVLYWWYTFGLTAPKYELTGMWSTRSSMIWSSLKG